MRTSEVTSIIRKGTMATPANEGIGQRMRKAIEDRRLVRLPDSRTPVKRTLLMNPVRRGLFALLCKRPCMTVAEIARALRTSRANTGWHIEKLIEAGIVSKRKFGGSWVFYPAHFLEHDDIPILSLLSDPFTMSVYKCVQAGPGITQAELGKALRTSRQALAWHISKLIRAGLIIMVRDGRFRRYKPTLLLETRARRHARRTAAFKGTLLRILKEDGTDPTIVKSLTRSLIVKLSSSRPPSMLEVELDPFAALLSV